MKTMQTMKTMKGGACVLALVFAASFLLLLPGCQAPVGPQADRTGTVSLTIGQLDMGRAIQPGTLLTDFTGFTAVFTRANHDDVRVYFATGETTAQAELPQGPWNLTVNAFIGTVVAATYGPRAITVEPGFNGVTATLAPIATGGYGTFSWALTVPPGTSGGLEIRGVDPDGNIMDTIVDTDTFSGGPSLVLWDDEMELTAGTYFVRFMLTHENYGVAFLNSDLHVYQGMESRIERTFTYALFRAGEAPTVITNAAITVTGPVTGELPDTVATVDGTNLGFSAGTVTWYPAHSPFQAETEYTATVTLTAHMGYVFADTLTTATINGQVADVVSNTGTAVTLEYTFAETGLEQLDPVIVAWEFTGNMSAGNAIVGPANITVLPSSGQQQYDALLQFLTQSGSNLTPRTLNGASSGINVVNPDGGGSGLNDLADNAWWQTAISTTGRTNIAVTWRMRSTAAGPRDWRLQYRVGGTSTWNNVGGTIALPTPAPANVLLAVEQGRFLPTTAEGRETLYLRWLMTSNFSVAGGTTAYGGTHQINDLVIFSDANPANFNNRDDQPGTFNVTWAGFANPLLADGVTITRNETSGAITVNAPDGAFTSIQWLDDNFDVLSSTATLGPGDGIPPLVTVRVRTAGSSRTYSIVFNTATGAVF